MYLLTRRLLLSLLLLALPALALAAPSEPATLSLYGQLPLSFEANQGQTDARVNYVARGGGYTLFLTPTEAILALSQTHKSSVTHTIRMQLLGANPTAAVAGLKTLPGVSNYFVGQMSVQWQRNIPNVAKVEYREVYPGVNVVYYGKQRQLEYDLVLAPGADPAVIQLAFTGATARLDEQGNLVLHTPNGEVRSLKYEVRNVYKCSQ